MASCSRYHRQAALLQRRENEETKTRGAQGLTWGRPCGRQSWELRGTRGLSHPAALPRAPWSQRLCKSMEPSP